MAVTSFPCPLCGKKWHSQARYPDAICDGCAEGIRDELGRTVEFGNSHIGGGLELLCGGQTYQDAESEAVPLFIGEKRVCLEEARFGGVVVRPVSPTGDKTDGVG